MVGRNPKDGYLLDSCTRHCGSWGQVQSEEGITQQVGGEGAREEEREGGREGMHSTLLHARV